MAYRIHFTVEDLARTRVAEPPPLMELSAAVRVLQTRSHPVWFGGDAPPAPPTGEALPASLHPPWIRWNAPLLEIATLSGFDGDLRLEGRRLLLVPSFFGADAIAIDIDAEPQPVIRYPIGRDQPSAPRFALPAQPTAPPGARSPLAALLDRTRVVVATRRSTAPPSSASPSSTPRPANPGPEALCVGAVVASAGRQRGRMLSAWP
ncbi:hypothetical protein NMG29_30840 [Streptomyces cocklensis]|uniref:Uncharacterized protein n=1 Tax=Actinacidiphila cocklensis TaxID=887465 RepID=A0A9W4GP07_9ACTN|nr:hypothetical protein [Actinacidiphila cocklensis]MDD1062556.1 hypothetical protein [Actinacidiphila cocklensis]CAG6391888.1 hypothetical protein SCOCK_140086 [Actinacidiphila cocklensis]